MMAVMAGTEDEEASTDAASLHDLYLAHHWSLVRLASLLLHDQAEAEETVQDAFVKAYVRWDRLRQPAIPTVRLAACAVQMENLWNFRRTSCD